MFTLTALFLFAKLFHTDDREWIRKAMKHTNVTIFFSSISYGGGVDNIASKLLREYIAVTPALYYCLLKGGSL